MRKFKSTGWATSKYSNMNPFERKPPFHLCIIKSRPSKNDTATSKARKKHVALSQKHLQALVAKSHLIDLSFGKADASKAVFDSSDLRTEKNKAALLLWILITSSVGVIFTYADCLS